MDNLDIFTSFAAATAAVVPIVSFIGVILNRIFKYELTGQVEQILSWIAAIGIALIGGWQDIGIFAELSFGWQIGAGVIIGLAANGIYDIAILKSLFDFLQSILKKEN